MRIMITGGGTGGHISPGLAVLHELQRRDAQLRVQWVGRRGGLEQRVCAARSIPFRGLPVEGWPRKNKLRRPWAAAKLALSMAWAWVLIKKFRPEAVFGVGGYVSLPLLYMAQRMGIPTALHEQNRLLGLANRLCAPKAGKVFLSFPDTKGTYPEARAEVVGNPVRAEFAEPPEREAARTQFGIESNVPVVLVVGGSQGAKRLNEALAAALPQCMPGSLQLLWMAGKQGYDAARSAAKDAVVPVQVFEFIDDMAAACIAADLVVSRSGASTTAELAMLGKPSLLVPFPHATDNHQEENARALESAGAAQVLLDADCTGDALRRAIADLLANRSALDEMGRQARTLARPAAADRIAEVILELVYQRAQQEPAPAE